MGMNIFVNLKNIIRNCIKKMDELLDILYEETGNELF